MEIWCVPENSGRNYFDYKEPADAHDLYLNEDWWLWSPVNSTTIFIPFPAYKFRNRLFYFHELMTWYGKCRRCMIGGGTWAAFSCCFRKESAFASRPSWPAGAGAGTVGHNGSWGQEVTGDLWKTISNLPVQVSSSKCTVPRMGLVRPICLHLPLPSNHHRLRSAGLNSVFPLMLYPVLSYWKL